MKIGTNRRTRDRAVRQGRIPSRTRDVRQRPLPTEHGHAARHRATGATRGYQSDSSSKRPIQSVASRPCP